MAQLEFDEEIAKQLDAAYQARDIVRRRELVRSALAAKPGERILDVGCGPGYYVAELLEEVGPEGSVTGVDGSSQMLAVAASRNKGSDNVAFHEGDATSLPVDDESFDGALSVQVLEYVPEVEAALAEMYRALKPGGRVLVWDTDFATLSMRSSDPDRMERVLRAADKHLTHPSLPRTLAGQLRSVGFEDVSMEAHPFATIELGPETYAGALLPIFKQFVAGREEIGEEEATAWWEEQQELADRGEFFQSITQFCFTAKRPA